MTSTPAENSSPAIGGVMPLPPAEFSPLAMTKSSACSFAQARQNGFDGLASGFAHDVANEQNFHGKNLTTKHAKHTKRNQSQHASAPMTAAASQSTSTALVRLKPARVSRCER